MKATGIVRRIDDLGRIVVPKEMRRVLRIRKGDPIEIFTDISGQIILKKYSPIKDLEVISEEFAKVASSSVGATVAISDTDQYISSYGKRRKEFLDKKIDFEVDAIIQEKEMYSDKEKIICPIVYQGDPIGSVTVIADESAILSSFAQDIALFGANFIAEQMEV